MGSRGGVFLKTKTNRTYTRFLKWVRSSVNGGGTPEVAGSDADRAESNIYGWPLGVARVCAEKTGSFSCRAGSLWSGGFRHFEPAEN